MKCSTCQNELVAYLLGELDSCMMDEVSIHLDSGCHDCNDELKRLNDSVDVLVDDLPLETAPAGPWSSIIEHFNAEESDWTSVQDRVLVTRVETSSRAIDSGLGRVAIGVFAIACGFALTFLSLRYANDPLPGDEIARVSAFPKMIEDNSEHTLPQLVSMRNREITDQVMGAMIINLVTNQVHFHVHVPSVNEQNVVSEGKPDRDRLWQAWFRTADNQWVLGGDLKPFGDDRFAAIIEIPVTDAPIVQSIVTAGVQPAPQLDESNIAIISDAFDAIRHPNQSEPL